MNMFDRELLEDLMKDVVTNKSIIESLVTAIIQRNKIIESYYCQILSIIVTNYLNEVSSEIPKSLNKEITDD